MRKRNTLEDIKSAAAATPVVQTPTFDEFLKVREVSNEGSDMPVKAPDGSPTPYVIRVSGMDSDHYRAAITRRTRDMAKILSETLSQEEQDDRLHMCNVDFMVALTRSWTIPGADFTAKNVRALYTEAPYIMDDVNQHANKRAVLFPKR